MYASSFNKTTMPTEISNTLVTVDMKTQSLPDWSNDTILGDVKARANPEVVWIPVGEQGILAVIGGVTFPGYITINGSSSNPASINACSDLAVISSPASAKISPVCGLKRSEAMYCPFGEQATQ